MEFQMIKVNLLGLILEALKSFITFFKYYKGCTK